MVNRVHNLIGKAAAFLRSAYVAPASVILRFARESGKGLRGALKECRNQVRQLAANTVPLLCAAVFMTTACTVSNTILAYEVRLDGELVGYVADSSLAFAAADAAADRVIASYGENYFADIEAKLCVTSADNIMDEAEVSTALIGASGELKEACGIYCGGKIVAICADKSVAEAIVNSRLDSYKNSHENCGEISIAYELEYRCGLFPAGEVMAAEKARLAAQNLPVMESVVETESTEIGFETLSSNSSQYCTGIVIVKTEGKKGLQEVTSKVCYIDGVEISREELSNTVVSEPVNEVLVVGTKVPVALPASELTWPLDSTVSYNISAYWGDGRGHKAIDIACKKGTAILAALGGEVVEVTYSHSTYGKSIVIDHGNGISTRYAHCDSLLVSLGDKIEAGQTIATVGTTGRASGSHLHFEYMINGEHVNPAKYLGLSR